MRTLEASVVIPTYNEKENVTEIVPQITESLDGVEHEIVIVDGNSEDGTAEAVEELMGEYEDLRLIEREEREGLGAAYRHAFGEVEGEVVVQMDADLSHPPEKVPELVEAVKDGADVAVGSRYVDSGERKDPFHRRVFPLIGSYLYRFLLNSPVRDVTSGFKAYRKERAEQISEADLPAGFHFQAASLFHLLGNGATVEEVPITFRERNAGEPKYDYPGDLIDNTLLLLKLAVKRHQRMLKFGVVGAIGTVVNMGLLYLFTEYVGLHYMISAGIAVESAIVSNFVLNDIWTFIDRKKEGMKNLMERFTKFQAVSLTGLGLNLGLLWTFTKIAGIYYLLSNLIAILIVFFWNYFINLFWTWTET
ncbi:MAG: glycosyltransferase [Candidatus Nanohaloarchaea archaeon]